MTDVPTPVVAEVAEVGVAEPVTTEASCPFLKPVIVLLKAGVAAP